jgi:hypothetical protein
MGMANTVSHVFNLTTRWRWENSLTTPSDTFSIAGLVALRVSLGALEEIKISCPGRIYGEEWKFLSL